LRGAAEADSRRQVDGDGRAGVIVPRPIDALAAIQRVGAVSAIEVVIAAEAKEVVDTGAAMECRRRFM
jgi:hypothetical protein